MKIFITKEIPEKGKEYLRQAGFELDVHQGELPMKQEELIQKAQSYQGLLIAGSDQLDQHFFDSCSHLKAISLMSVGYDNVDLAVATTKGIPVSNTPDVLSKATSDIAFLLMLAVSRDAFNRHKSIEHGQWKGYGSNRDLGIELYGKTLGVFGLGRIGQELALKAKAAYQMDIIYHNRNRNTAAEEQLNAVYVSFEELLEKSDVISVHVNLTDQTKETFDAAAFEKMKKSAIFINTARGGIHNEKDLIEALQEQKIWGAGLDVTNPEPMEKDNPLLNLPHVCVLPHVGSATVETRNAMAVLAAKNLTAALQDQKMPQIINKEVYE